MPQIAWFTNDQVDQAVGLAQRNHRPILVDFWSPTCLGCAKLFKLTYADPAVREFLAANLICVKYNTTAPNPWFKRLTGSVAHMWHPHLLILDERLVESRRVVGYQPPLQLIAHLKLGIGLLHLYHRRYQDALDVFHDVTLTHVAAGILAEALYWKGVAAYRVDGGLPALRAIWGQLQAEHGRSDWAQRADCLDLSIPEQGFSTDDPDSVQLISRLDAVSA
jgi:thiol-disulfide isomerase/thioredoxin